MLKGVEELADLISKACGIPRNWAKACIYYCGATHFLADIDWMPTLSLTGKPGCGKSIVMTILETISYEPYPFACHDGMSRTALRNELFAASEKTAIIEETSLYPNQRELENFIINRVNRKTANISLTQQVEVNKHLVWKPTIKGIFGPTIVHNRHDFSNLATERRTIVVPFRKLKDRKFTKPTAELLKGLVAPSFSYGVVPAMFNAKEIEDAPLDTWEPLIRVADGSGDNDWLAWAWGKVAEMGDNLTDGMEYEMETIVLKSVIAEACMGNLLSTGDIVLVLQDVANTVRTELRRPDMINKEVSTKLRKVGFSNIHGKGGKTLIFTTDVEIRKIAGELDYEDECLATP